MSNPLDHASTLLPPSDILRELESIEDKIYREFYAPKGAVFSRKILVHDVRTGIVPETKLVQTWLCTYSIWKSFSTFDRLLAILVPY